MEKITIMKKQKKFIGVALISVLAWSVYSCSNESDMEVYSPNLPSQASLDDPQSDPLNMMIAEFLSFDYEQSMVVLEEVEPWVNESIELDDSTASAHLPVIIGAKAVGFYTYDAEKDGWRQFLLVANHEQYLSVLEGDLIDPEGIEYEVEGGKKKPKKKKHPKPVKEKFGSRKGCNVFQCSNGGNCLPVAYIPCGGQKSNCTTNADCQGQTQGVGSDDVRGGIADY